jgi:hypothetical protein
MVKFECYVSGATLINGFKVVQGTKVECNQYLLQSNGLGGL